MFYVCVYIYIYIHTFCMYGEREREREIVMYNYLLMNQFSTPNILSLKILFQKINLNLIIEIRTIKTQNKFADPTDRYVLLL